jgi:hypothetical protein
VTAITVAAVAQRSRRSRPPASSAGTSRTAHHGWLAALLALSVWSMLPPYVGPWIGLELNVSAAVEAVDHLLPGAVATAASGYALILGRRGETETTGALAALGLCALAGLWETASHLPLVLDAGDSERPWDAVLFHSAAGPAMVIISLWLLLRGPRNDSGAT